MCRCPWIKSCRFAPERVALLWVGLWVTVSARRTVSCGSLGTTDGQAVGISKEATAVKLLPLCDSAGLTDTT